MGNNSRWPEAWDRLVDRVNQDPDIEAYEKIDSFNGGRGAISSLKNLKTKEKFTCFTSHDSMYDGKMGFVYDDDYTIPAGRSVKGKRRRTQTLATVDELIDLFNKSYNSAGSENEMGIPESKQPIKLKSLIEGYAWERKPGKPLPTLSEVQAEHERKLQEKTEYEVAGRPVTLNKNGSEKQADWSVTFKNGQTKQYHEVASLLSPRPKLQPRWWDSDGDGKPYEPGDDVKAEGVNEADKFYPGGPNNDEPFDFKDDKPSRPKMQTPKEWDDLMDIVNNDPRFETYTGPDGYQIKDTKGGRSNLIWQLTPGRFSWKGIGRASAEYPHPRQIDDVKELIKNFYEVTGLSNPDNSNVNLGENMRRFGTKNI